MNPQKIVLASASPRRRDLLLEHGFEIVVSPAIGVEEIAPDYFTISETTLFNAKKKAVAVAQENPDALVLGADTLVALDGATLGKPQDLREAKKMLARLSGRTHEVFTGVWLMRISSGKMYGFVEVSRVKFRSLTAKEIERYIELVNPLDKAGAYAAQTNEMNVIERIEGSKSNVIGLPMETLEEALRTTEF